jgi:hypothetical protein
MLLLVACTFVTDAEWAARMEACERTWYDDADGDGFGGEPFDSCQPPAHPVGQGGDCDDGDPAVNPAAAEYWYDGVDQDCSGGSDFDQDGDGHDALVGGGDDCYDATTDELPVMDGDCDEPSASLDPAQVYPGASDVSGDGVDADCSGGTDYDADGDGYAACEECDDTDPTVVPNDAAEIWYDGIDQNCDGNDGDQDGDGWVVEGYAFTPGVGQREGDCADDPAVVSAALNGFDDLSAADIHPEATDAGYDGIDQACDGGDDFDLDVDGYRSDTWPDEEGELGDDCDDADGAVHPGAIESWYDGVDADCSGGSDYDQDGDGADSSDWGGDDCDDLDGAVFPGAPEDCETAYDDNCDGALDEEGAAGCTSWFEDADADGWGSTVSTCTCDAPTDYVAVDGDCDDADATVSPEGTETCVTTADDDCDGEANEVDAPACVAWYDDADGDGYGGVNTVCACDASAGYPASSADDCDDTDASVGAGTTWYADADGDGYGDPASSATACSAVAGYVASGDDCDDTSASVSPAATETCSTTADDDCDGDDNDQDATGCSAYHTDNDADGYGDAASSVCLCTASAVWPTTDATDCDDGDATVSPAGTESCATEADDDCDGVTNENNASDCTAYYLDGDGDGYGVDGISSCWCEPTGAFATSVTGDCDDTDASVSPGATETCSSSGDEDCDGTADEADASGCVTYYADSDGDGYAGGSGSCLCGPGGGYDFTSPEDCDDTDSSVSPAATEVCATSADDDCDGSANEAGAADCASWYYDGDGDGYGTTTSACQCSASGSFTASNDSDCDDGDAAVSPAASELCSTTVDDDCDGEANESSAADAITVYLDGDADGYGVSSVSATGCSSMSGFAATAGDCDDTDSTVNPGASETCDAVDEDCDGSTDEDATDAGTWYLDADADGYGTSSSTTTGCALPPGYAADDSDCDDADSSVSPAASEVCSDGLDNDCDGLAAGCSPQGSISLASADATFGGDAGLDYAGYAVAWAGDADGDGADDALVGAYGSDTGATGAGAVYVVTAATSSADLSASGLLLTGVVAGDAAGTAVARLADGAVAVGARSNDDGGADAGAVYILDGGQTGTLSLSSADAELTGAAGDQAGGALAGGGDGDDDGTVDLLVGAARNDDGGTNAGAAFLVDGASSSGALSGALAEIIGEDPYDYAGISMAFLGDVDGDGADDVAVGASGNDAAASGAGAAYLLYGPLSGSRDLSTADARLTGTATSDEAGTAVAGGYDLDGDGLADLVVGAPGDDTGETNAGAAYAFFGAPSSGSVTTADAMFVGEEKSGYAGTAVSTGDIDGDGVGDVVVGAYADGGGAVFLFYGPPAGTTYVGAADALVDGIDTSDYAGRALAADGDANGDGYDDLLIGAWGADDGGSSSGAAYVVLGGGF